MSECQNWHSTATVVSWVRGPSKVSGAIRDGFLEEKEFEPRSELNLSLNGCLTVVRIFLFWILFCAWSKLDEVIVGLTHLSGGKEVERGSTSVTAIGDP